MRSILDCCFQSVQNYNRRCGNYRHFRVKTLSRTTFTGGMVSTYCPAFLSLFVKCKGADAQGHHVNNKDIDMTAFNTQKDRNCDGPTRGEKCTEVYA